MDQPAKTADTSATPSPPDAARSPDLSGRTLNDFQLIRRLGQGGMGQVYLARQTSLKRQVAVKILRAELAANTSSLQRFRAEAEAVARLTHPNIVQIYTTGEADGLHYMALEYVEGKNLRDYLSRKGPPDTLLAVSIMRQVAAALQRAGELGLVHRDIKPENILLTRKAEVKVADFGLSRCFAPDAEPLNITQSGVTMGTPLYMSPEQVQGRPVDPRSDIYSFGVSCYHMLAGHPPFRGDSPFEVALQHVQSEPPPLGEARPDLPRALCELVHRMMAKRPEDRPQNAREIVRDLTRVRDAMTAGGPLPAAPEALSLSGIGRTDSTPFAPPTAPAAVVPGRARRVPGVVLMFGVLVAAAAGAAVRWQSSGPTGSVLPVVSEPDPRELADARFAEAVKAALRRLDDKDIRLEAADEALLELLMLYVRDRKYDAARELIDGVPKRAAFQDASKGPRVGEVLVRFHNMIVMELARGILAAHRDQPEPSCKSFLAVLDPTRLPGKFKPGAVSPVDLFFGRHPKWKKEVADAIHRNAVNLEGRPLDPQLERYRSYVPKLLQPDKKS